MMRVFTGTLFELFSVENSTDDVMPSSSSPSPSLYSSSLPDESFNLDKILNDDIREDEDLVSI